MASGVYRYLNVVTTVLQQRKTSHTAADNKLSGSSRLRLDHDDNDYVVVVVVAATATATAADASSVVDVDDDSASGAFQRNDSVGDNAAR